jgi:hypothetical protein
MTKTLRQPTAVQVRILFVEFQRFPHAAKAFMHSASDRTGERRKFAATLPRNIADSREDSSGWHLTAETRCTRRKAAEQKPPRLSRLCGFVGSTIQSRLRRAAFDWRNRRDLCVKQFVAALVAALPRCDKYEKSTLKSVAHGFCLAVVSVWITDSPAQDASGRFDDFSRDPQWESYRSRLLPNPIPVTRQDFGWRHTPHADGRPGAIGGWIQRSVTPAWFAKVIPNRTLNDKLSASGKFAVTRDEGGSGVLFGWFHETSRGWRTPNSLTLRLDGNGGKYWVLYEYGTRHWLTGGAGCFEGDRYQTTTTKPFRADGTTHTWSLDYDPEGANGNGLLKFVLDGTNYTLALEPDHKADGAEFNRFGLFNLQTTGSGMEVSFRELMLDGQWMDLTSAAGWEGRGNKVEFEDRRMRPFHDFGWIPEKADASLQPGSKGELGGVIWRDEKPAYYASRIGLLSLEDELFASGTIKFDGAGSDSGVYLGWFNSHTKTNKMSSDHEAPQKNLLAVLIEGPSRIGHYFRAAYGTATGEGVMDQAGPIIRPDGRSHRWFLRYSPQSQGGGQITVQLDGETRILAVSPEHRKQGASFDRFGLFNMQVGGHFVDISLDDLNYTAKSK